MLDIRLLSKKYESKSSIGFPDLESAHHSIGRSRPFLSKEPRTRLDKSLEGKNKTDTNEMQAELDSLEQNTLTLPCATSIFFSTLSFSPLFEFHVTYSLYEKPDPYVAWAISLFSSMLDYKRTCSTLLHPPSYVEYYGCQRVSVVSE